MDAEVYSACIYNLRYRVNLAHSTSTLMLTFLKSALFGCHQRDMLRIYHCYIMKPWGRIARYNICFNHCTSCHD